MKIFLITLFISTSLFAEIKSGLIKMSENRELLVSFNINERPSNQENLKNSEYVFILGPGVNRGMLPNDQMMKLLEEKNYNFVSFHNSTHPHSLVNSQTDVKPLHQDKFFETEDYAEEFEFISMWAQEQFKLRAIPVSLSFSGAASSKLSNFDYIIDISPMISQKDALPELASYRETLERANVFNPFREMVIRQAMDQSYAYVWRPKAREFVKAYKLDNKFVDTIYEGYMASSRSLEKFKWDVNGDKQENRIFILGENEKESLNEGQVRTVKEYLAQGKNLTCFFMRGMGHSIPMEAPQYTMAIIEFVVNHSTQLKPGCYDVSKELKAEFYPVKELEKLFPIK